MDTDWCLTCSKHLPNTAASYCSIHCRYAAGPSTATYCYPPTDDADDEYDDDDETLFDELAVDDAPVYHHSAGISAWAASIPAGPPCPPRMRRSAAQSRKSPSPKPPSSPASVSTITYRPPELLRPHRPVPPTLCMSKPQPVPSSPSVPVMTPQAELQELSAASTHTSADSSLLATPASTYLMPFSDRKHSVIDSIASHVRSWVAPSFVHQHEPKNYSSDEEDIRWNTNSPSSKPSRTVSRLEITRVHDYRVRGRNASRAVA
ncbi:hypothetical protein FA15DRAFT_253119 [Coprinopsis marcescibilis]|uniref:Uncharacterized protein n=1 Tax=Coprinopsis marcescibilis TaxID=230819 RepID=A0A5C3KFC8_COPMA|nr:hypothetical protein FA15DRAFT_253119 [Coprinopsis marcescibilis]